jgi:hypothetical protein
MMVGGVFRSPIFRSCVMIEADKQKLRDLWKQIVNDPALASETTWESTEVAPNEVKRVSMSKYYQECLDNPQKAQREFDAADVLVVDIDQYIKAQESFLDALKKRRGPSQP